MKPIIMEILVCPVCKGQLNLTVAEQKDGEIISGSLYCGTCACAYPIIDTIPHLLPPDFK